MPAAVKLMVWFFVFDNFMDNPAHMGADMRATQLLVDVVMTVFRNTVAVGGDPSGIIKSGDDPEIIVGTNDEECDDYGRAIIRVLWESARDWWEEMRQLGMSPRQQYRFLSAVERYLDASMKQVAFRQLRHVPSVDTYKELRHQSAGWYVSSVILEFVWGLDPPDEIVEHPLLSALNVAASSHIMLVNDIFSFPKELLAGDIMNLVAVLTWHNLGRSQHSVEALVQETVSQLLGLVREADEECVLLMETIRATVQGGQLGKEAAAMEKYVQGVSDWLSGCLQWHRISRRYVNDDDNNNNNNNHHPSISIGI